MWLREDERHFDDSKQNLAMRFFEDDLERRNKTKNH